MHKNRLRLGYNREAGASFLGAQLGVHQTKSSGNMFKHMAQLAKNTWWRCEASCPCLLKMELTKKVPFLLYDIHSAISE
jgi:hypothetical protein